MIQRDTVILNVFNQEKGCVRKSIFPFWLVQSYGLYLR